MATKKSQRQTQCKETVGVTQTDRSAGSVPPPPKPNRNQDSGDTMTQSLVKVFIPSACLDLHCGHQRCIDWRDIKRVQQDIAEIANKLNQRNRSINELNDQSKVDRETISSLEQQVCDAQKLKVALDNLQGSYDELNVKEQTAQSKVQRAIQDEADVEKSLSALRLELEKDRKVSFKLRIEHEDLTDNFDALKAVHESLQISLSDRVSELKEVNDKLEATRKELQTLRETNTGQSSEITKARKELQSAEHQLPLMRAMKKSIESQISDADSKIQSLELSLNLSHNHLEAEKDYGGRARLVATLQADLLDRAMLEINQGVKDHCQNTRETYRRCEQNISKQHHQRTQSDITALTDSMSWLSRVCGYYRTESEVISSWLRPKPATGASAYRDAEHRKVGIGNGTDMAKSESGSNTHSGAISHIAEGEDVIMHSTCSPSATIATSRHDNHQSFLKPEALSLQKDAKLPVSDASSSLRGKFSPNPHESISSGDLATHQASIKAIPTGPRRLSTPSRSQTGNPTNHPSSVATASSFSKPFVRREDVDDGYPRRKRRRISRRRYIKNRSHDTWP